MKKTFLTICLILICVGSLAVIASATTGNKSLSWYCIRTKDHSRAPLPSELEFISEYNGYYIGNDEKVLYLTFDAGYENGNVEKTLDILQEQQVPAAFFILENLVVKNTDLVKRMANEGHTVCNHTSHHKDMSSWGNDAVLEEVQSLENVYREHIGTEMAKYYRPPEGVFSCENLDCLAENGYKTVFWSFAYPDWDNHKQMSAEKAKQIILENLHNGEVMLLHPTSNTNVAILADIICEIRAQGYRFGTLDELTGATTE